MFKKISILTLAVTAMIAGYWVSTSLNDSLDKADSMVINYSPQKSKIQGYILDPARVIKVPPLKKDDGTAFVNEDLKDHWSLLFFGYTHCPDICPITMNVLAQSAELVNKEGMVFPEVFFISVDPQRDTVEMLGEYVRYFDSAFTGVTGEIKMIEALTLQAGIAFMKVPSNTADKENYLVDHSASILLINPQGNLKAYLKPPHSPETILNSIKVITTNL